MLIAGDASVASGFAEGGRAGEALRLFGNGFNVWLRH